MGKLKQRLKFFIGRFLSPQIYVGYKNLKHVRVSNTAYIGTPENLELKDHVFIGHYNFIDASNGVKIGEGCQLTNFVSLITHSSHQAIRLYGKEFVKQKAPKAYHKGSVEIGDYTFVGPHSVIMPGTKIGKGCVVAAYSYVQGDFPDFSIITGNPAKVVGSTQELDEQLLQEHPELKSSYEDWAKTNS